MKVEVDYEEIEYLKKDIKSKEQQIKDLKSRLDALSEDRLKKDALEFSVKMFNDYMASVFEKLGFSKDYSSSAIVFKDDVHHWLGEKWYSHKRIDFELGAYVTSNFKRAFLKIGVKTE